MTRPADATEKEEVIRTAALSGPETTSFRLNSGRPNDCELLFTLARRHGEPAIRHDQAIRFLTTGARPLPVSVRL